jgi:ketosteroid isomerase-like protein
MSEENVNVEVLHAVFERGNREGIAGMATFFDPDFVWHTDPRVPEPGVYKGAANVTRYLDTLWELLGGQVRLEVKENFPLDERRVFAMVAAHTTTRGSEREVILLDWCFIVTFRNQRLVELHSFLDRDEALQAAGLSE